MIKSRGQLLPTVPVAICCGLLVLPLIGCSESHSTGRRTYESKTGRDNTFEERSGETRVDYYNPKTGTRSEYKLDVDYQDGEVDKIKFDNGGYIDRSHIDSQTDNGDGTVTVRTDRGTEYTVDKDGDD